uniref:Ground-like domain-containing protein n=1 Tax=Parastrongyloides trichosuri TaxID=131310 RepID=A0A0N4ZPA0_PARTI
MIKYFIFILILPFTLAQFFGAGGGSSCCCGCSSPQPSFCGCSQESICPPPQPCPPIPPPRPCPPPPIAICPAPQPIYLNQACSGCSDNSYQRIPSRGGCRTRYVVLRSNKTFKEQNEVPVLDGIENTSLQNASQTTNFGDEKCNNEELKNIILQNITPNDALQTKHAIHEAVSRIISNSIINVICSESSFTYLIIGTPKYCEAQKDGVICFIFQNP